MMINNERMSMNSTRDCKMPADYSWYLVEVTWTTKKFHQEETIYRTILYTRTDLWVWTGNQRQKSRIQLAEMKNLRKTLKLKRIYTGRKQLNIILVQKIEEKKVGWFGHIIRMDEHRQVKRVWEAGPDGKNAKGRQRKNWSKWI